MRQDLWGNCSKTALEKLAKMQKRAARLILAGNNLHIERSHPKSFSHLGATLWNNIPAPIRDAKSLKNFKTLYIENYLLNS